MTRRRIAFLQDLAADLRDAARRRQSGAPDEAPEPAPEPHTAAELERRLDETRERLRREVPPPEDH